MNELIPSKSVYDNDMQTPHRPRRASAHCCICKEGIEFETNAEGEAISPTGFDPCALILTTNIFGPRSDQREQDFLCHAECFRKIVDDDSIMFILGPNFSTIGQYQGEQEREER